MIVNPRPSSEKGNDKGSPGELALVVACVLSFVAYLVLSVAFARFIAELHRAISKLSGIA